ncbi:hypothetical protein [Gemmobacter sp. 24YEA27]|uniref:hypothetical protein n=1 Tax=Gemmobacter sp. 24YEA27 TaxID=3040672 RepID=UPI0024B3B754|nr:hypothetical protein [Gemmobacter sp. 24YEA27]
MRNKAGQGRQQADQDIHDRLRTAVIIAKQDRIAADTLHHGCDIGRAKFTPENHQIRFPMAENLTRPDQIRTIADHATLWKYKALWLASIARFPFAPAFRQMATKLQGLTVFRVDVAVDRLVADPRQVAFVTQTASDLFWRPAVFQPIDHSQAQVIVPDQFALPRPSR